MDKEIWIAILSFGTAAVGAIRWLIHVYWRQAEQIEDLRSQNEKRTIQQLKDAIDDLKKSIEVQKRALQEATERILKAQAAVERSTKEQIELGVLVSKHIEQTAQRFQKLDSQIVQLAQGLVMVKSGGSGGSGSKKN